MKNYMINEITENWRDRKKSFIQQNKNRSKSSHNQKKTGYNIIILESSLKPKYNLKKNMIKIQNIF